MSSQTRIVILKMRTVIYTGIFIFLILVLGVLLFLMFGHKTENTENSAAPASLTTDGSSAVSSASSTSGTSGISSSSGTSDISSASGTSSISNTSGISSSSGASGASLYYPGCYHSVMKLGDYSVNVSVTVSADRIESIQLQDVSQEVLSAYPVLEPAAEDLTEKILTTQSTAYLTYDETMQYTQTALTATINTALKKAAVSESDSK